MRTTLFALALLLSLFPLALSALQSGTNQVEFVLSQTGLDAGQTNAVALELDRIMLPSASTAVCDDVGGNSIVFDGFSLPPPLCEELPFEVGLQTGTHVEIPVVSSFASNVMAKIAFSEIHSNEVTLAESFRQSLDQAFSETNGIAFLATNFVSRRFGVDPIPLTAATNIWASWRSWTSYPIPRTSLVRREVGPVQNAEFLWAFIPMNTGTSVFWLPIIFADSRWKISMWDYELQGYSWE